MPLVNTSITALFCCIDDFAKTFEDWEQHRLIDTGRQRLRSGKLSLSEMLFIMVLFHGSAYKDFKHFWLYGVEIEWYCNSKALFRRLWQRGLHLITGIRRNMKNYLLPLLDKILLRKRFIIETLFDKLKSGMGLEHTRHRSPTNAFVHILSCVAAYVLAQPKVKMGKIIVPDVIRSISNAT